MNIAIDSIRTNGGTQTRSQIDWLTVDEYAAAMTDGAQFPPVVVFYDGATYWMADGFHRLDAARKAGQAEIAADVRQGTQRDAVLHSVGANASHGLRRTNEDKRRAVLRLLEDSEWGKWSNVVIARLCNVSDPFVMKLRNENNRTSNVRSSEPRTYTQERNGKTYTYEMQTAKIGKPAPVVYVDDCEPNPWDEEEEEEEDEEKEFPDSCYEYGQSALCKYCYTYQTEWHMSDEYGVWTCPNCEHSTADAFMQIGEPDAEEESPEPDFPFEPLPGTVPPSYRGQGLQSSGSGDSHITIHNINAQYLAAHITTPVHLVVTSPPYNVGLEYNSHNDSLSTYIELITAVWKQCFQVMVDGARIAVVVPFGVGRNPWVPLAARIADTLQAAGFTLRGQIIWDKGTSGGRTTWGSFRLPSDPSLRDTCEAIVIAHKGQSKLEIPDGITEKDEKGTHSPWLAESDRFMELAQDHWSISPESATRVKHPAPFPVELVEKLLRFYAFPAAHVIDPFAGSGTVGIAAHTLGCTATLFEIDATYCQLAQRRIDELVSADVR